MTKTTVVDKEKRVVIVTNGIAIGIAKCRKDDVFDVTVGKRLANARYEDDLENQGEKIFGYVKTGVVPLITKGAKAFEKGRIYKITSTKIGDEKVQYFDFDALADDIDDGLSIINGDGESLSIKYIEKIKKTKFRVGDRIIIDGELLTIEYPDRYEWEFLCSYDCGRDRFISIKDAKKGRKEYKKLYGGKK